MDEGHIVTTETIECRNRIEGVVQSFTLDPKETYTFYVTYGRYESAAKSLGWVTNLEVGSRLQVCPKRVAEASEPHFSELVKRDPRLLRAISYFYKNPPRAQKMGHDGSPVWDDVPRTTKSLHRILENLAQARNNLVHGGKGWEPEECKKRDQEVIGHGLIILCSVICCTPELAERFFVYPD